MGFVMSEGAVIDLGRMKTIDFDEKNWLVKVGAGVCRFRSFRKLLRCADSGKYCGAFGTGLRQHHVFRNILYILGELRYCSG